MIFQPLPFRSPPLSQIANFSPLAQIPPDLTSPDGKCQYHTIANTYLQIHLKIHNAYVILLSMSYTCKYHLRSSVSHHKTPLHSHQIKAVEIIQPVGFYYVYLLQRQRLALSPCVFLRKCMHTFQPWWPSGPLLGRAADLMSTAIPTWGQELQTIGLVVFFVGNSFTNERFLSF